MQRYTRIQHMQIIPSPLGLKDQRVVQLRYTRAGLALKLSFSQPNISTWLVLCIQGIFNKVESSTPRRKKKRKKKQNAVLHVAKIIDHQFLILLSHLQNGDATQKTVPLGDMSIKRERERTLDNNKVKLLVNQITVKVSMEVRQFIVLYLFACFMCYS